MLSIFLPCIRRGAQSYLFQSTSRKSRCSMRNKQKIRTRGRKIPINTDNVYTLELYPVHFHHVRFPYRKCHSCNSALLCQTPICTAIGVYSPTTAPHQHAHLLTHVSQVYCTFCERERVCVCVRDVRFGRFRNCYLGYRKSRKVRESAGLLRSTTLENASACDRSKSILLTGGKRVFKHDSEPEQTRERSHTLPHNATVQVNRLRALRSDPDAAFQTVQLDVT
jgi:hypothetical protein